MVMVDNDQDLTNLIMADMTGIVNEVTDELYKKLTDDGGFIDDIVYGAGTPNVYKRNKMSGGLQGEWDKTNARVSGNTITAEITENPNKMIVDPDNYIHGSRNWIKEDIREILSDIITLGKSGPLFGEGYWRSPRDFWTPFVKMLEDGSTDKLIEKAFKSRGIKFKKI